MHRLVPALEHARASRSRKVKVAAVAEALRAIALDGDDDELATAARIVSGSVLPTRDGAVLGVGFALVMSAACDAYGLAPKDLQTRARSLGDVGDAIYELASAAAGSDARPGLTVSDVADIARELAGTTDRTAKAATLRDAYARARPDQAKYLTKVLLGELRVGVREGVLEEAIAEAFGRDVKEVRAAATLTTDPGDLAVFAKHDELSGAALVVGSPLAFMLASPVEVVKAPIDAARTAWEDKLDGVRVQVHVQARVGRVASAETGFVKLFARGGGDVSAVFPEVVRALASSSSDVVLDGELLAVTADRRPRPFQALQVRLNRRDPDPDLLARVPVALFAFDMLSDGAPMLALPWSERRLRLEAFFAPGTFSPVAQPTLVHGFDASRTVEEEIDAAYADARARGHEGIVLKAVDAVYEAGRRGSAWRKVKRAVATLDVVITRAERGHGKRAKVLSDYTFAVWDAAEGERSLVEIGKAYSGLTDAEIAAMTVELEASTVETRGAQLLVAPRFVLEVAFDGLQPSSRHGSGFALRFPRIVRIRDDKRPEDADTLATARALFDAQVATGHREDARPEEAAKKRTSAGTRKRAPRAQLGLFGEDE